MYVCWWLLMIFIILMMLISMVASYLTWRDAIFSWLKIQWTNLSKVQPNSIFFMAKLKPMVKLGFSFWHDLFLMYITCMRKLTKNWKYEGKFWIVFWILLYLLFDNILDFIYRRGSGNRSFGIGVFGERRWSRVDLGGLGILFGVGSGGCCGCLGSGFWI